MGEREWIRRRPGSISGTVLPPPAGAQRLAPDDPGAPRPAPLPRRRPGGSGARTRRPQPAAGAAGEGTAGAGAVSEGVAGAGTAGEGVAGAGTARGGSGPGGAGEERPGTGRAAAGRSQVAWLAVLSAAVIVVAAGTAVALVRHQGAAPRSGLASLTGAAQARTQAARWVAGQVSRSAIIGCDTVMCAALNRAGVPSADLLVLRPSAPDPLGADIIVATPVLRAQFGSRLPGEYAPSLLAAFGSGQARVDIRVVAADGAAAYRAALRRDAAARKLAGQVDARLLLVLPALAGVHPVRVLGFGGLPPGAGPGIQRCSVLLAGSDRASGLSTQAYLTWMLSFLQGQRVPYRPVSVLTRSQDGRQIVAVRFALPKPIGLIHS